MRASTEQANLQTVRGRICSESCEAVCGLRLRPPLAVRQIRSARSSAPDRRALRRRWQSLPVGGSIASRSILRLAAARSRCARGYGRRCLPQLLLHHSSRSPFADMVRT
jgi:hypothetical protein